MEHEGAPIIAVTGKGGVGKTALSALLAKALRDQGVRPLLLIDADPVGGLTHAIGEGSPKTLAMVRADLIDAARTADQRTKERLAEQLDYMVLEALLERDDYSLLAMGHATEKGCYCSVNSLLREALDLIVAPFAAVLIDAEAGIEQINRQVTRRVSHVVAVVDGSQRSLATLGLIGELTRGRSLGVVVNRSGGSVPIPEELPPGASLLGVVPEDPQLAQLDREGRPLWELPEDNAALLAITRIAAELVPVGA